MARDLEDETLIELGRKPYVAPQVIFSELYANGVGVKNPTPTPDFHSAASTATS